MEKKDIKKYKKYICENITELNSHNLKDIFNNIKIKIDEKYLNQNLDGIRINLKYIDDHIIYELYKLIEYKYNEEIKNL